MATVVFIGCGKRKASGVKPAKDLYTGRFFCLSLAVARTLTTDSRIFVLSAKYGVVPLSKRIASYDLKLSQLSKRDRDDWRERVRAFVDTRLAAGDAVSFVCGSLYHKTLSGTRVLPESLGMGEQMSWMMSYLRRLKKPRFNIGNNIRDPRNPSP